MPTLFPGMDPYLERRGIWEQVHTDLIVSIRRFLTPILRPRYHVGIEERTYLAVLPPDEQGTGIPDVLITSPRRDSGSAPTATTFTTHEVVQPLVAELPLPEEVTERYLEIRTVPEQQVITVIEILSPSNKLTREGRAQYEGKRLKVLGSSMHLVEIDLLRAGHPFPMKAPGHNDYRIIISRSQHRPRADIYLFGVRDLIPTFPIPLRPGETEPTLPLNHIVHELYDQGGYDLIIDYRQPPQPLLSKEDAAWARQLVTQSVRA
jgi:uncharacterized protein DUF4058